MPILGRLEKFLREQKGQALPKSQYGKAVGYALNHWAELCRFTESGLLEIDNNIAERTMRLCAIGRKNWLFVGSDRGGETAATCFSILAGAKRHRIEPFAYVRDLLVAISTGEPDWTLCCPMSGSRRIRSTSCITGGMKPRPRHDRGDDGVLAGEQMAQSGVGVPEVVAAPTGKCTSGTQK